MLFRSQLFYDLTYMWNLKENKLIDSENRGTYWWLLQVKMATDKIGERDQKVQTCTNKINVMGWNVQHGVFS